jgi:hypothetical protein
MNEKEEMINKMIDIKFLKNQYYLSIIVKNEKL